MTILTKIEWKIIYKSVYALKKNKSFLSNCTQDNVKNDWNKYLHFNEWNHVGCNVFQDS